MHSSRNLRFGKQPPGPTTISCDLRGKRLPEHLDELIAHFALHFIKRDGVLTTSLEDFKLFLLQHLSQKQTIKTPKAAKRETYKNGPDDPLIALAIFLVQHLRTPTLNEPLLNPLITQATQAPYGTLACPTVLARFK
jgi:hypothetical protein